MSSPKPPALASWLLQHFARRDRRDALLGDLLEKFGERPSVAWYWRQVLAAIVIGFWPKLRSYSIAVFFSILYGWVITTLTGPRWFGDQIEFAIRRGILLAYPISLVYLIVFAILLNTAILSLALGIFLSITKTLGVKRFLKGYTAGFVGLISGYAILMIIFRVTIFGPVSGSTRILLARSFPLFAAILAAMLAATLQPHRTVSKQLI